MGTIICYNNNNIKIILQIDHTIITSDQDLTFSSVSPLYKLLIVLAGFVSGWAVICLWVIIFSPFLFPEGLILITVSQQSKRFCYQGPSETMWTSLKHYQNIFSVPWKNSCYRKIIITVIKFYSQPISEGALSPDGSVLATASEDGYIKFWQLPDKVECMHEFQPHGGQPLSCMIFTDNQTSQDKE